MIAIFRSRRLEHLLRMADILLAVLLCVCAWLFFPYYLKHTLAYVTAAAWLSGIFMVSGHNPAYLHPRHRIAISMSLSTLFAAGVGIFWGGSGWHWYMEGGLLSLIVLTIAGSIVRLLASFIVEPQAFQLIPCWLPKEFAPLLQEIAHYPHVRLERMLTDATQPLPERRAGFPIYQAVADLHVNEREFATLQPLYARIEVVDICELYEHMVGKIAMIHTEHGWALPSALRVPSAMYGTGKRLLDIAGTLLVSPLILVILAVVALAIKLTSPGPVFIAQERLGRYGVPFRMFKLRTMIADAERCAPQWAGARDPRVTPLGHILRIMGIDELPQFWNILRGEMSLIGPRPERPEIARHLDECIPFYSARLLATPGITGWAQTHQGGDTTVDDVTKKVQHDLYYLKYLSLPLDCQILLGTMQMVLHLAKPGPKQATQPFPQVAANDAPGIPVNK